MDWLKSLFRRKKTDEAINDDKPDPMEKRALELCSLGAQQLESGSISESIVTFSKSLSYHGRSETYLHRAKAFLQKGQLQDALTDIDLGLNRSTPATSVAVANELKALKESVGKQISCKSAAVNKPPDGEPGNLISLEQFLKETPSQLGEALIQTWLSPICKHLESKLDCLEFESFGDLPLKSEFAVWHPLNDLHTAPRIVFGSTPYVYAVWVKQELIAYVLWTDGNIANWCEVGDASTDTDRFFLVATDQFESAIDWLNEDPVAFENLGGPGLIKIVAHDNGTRMVVIRSYDGKARVCAGFTEARLAVCAIIEC